jgi:hypothetical protein
MNLLLAEFRFLHLDSRNGDSTVSIEHHSGGRSVILAAEFEDGGVFAFHDFGQDVRVDHNLAQSQTP